MTTVALIFVKSDREAARELGATLAAAGRSVLFTEYGENGPLVDRDEVTDYVLVIWSPVSRSSPFIYERAREALVRRRLIQCAVEGLAREQLAPVFRRGSVLAVTDKGKLLQAIPEEPPPLFLAAVAGAPRYANEPSRKQRYDPSQQVPVQPAASVPHASPAPARSAPGGVECAVEGAVDAGDQVYAEHVPNERVHRQASSVPNPAVFKERSQAALEKQAGQLVHKIPSRMKLGVTEHVEVRLGQALQQIAHGLVGSGALTSEELLIVETMTVTLDGSPDAFSIVRRTRATQLVLGSLIWKGQFEEQRFGRWLWYVRPKRTGTHELLVKVSADLSDSRGVPTSEALRDRVFPIRIKVDYATASARAVKWAATGAAGAVLTALIGAYTKDVWWPQIRLMLAGFGLAD